jgi:predicted HAD superfamily phosphohydrolase YqeG
MFKSLLKKVITRDFAALTPNVIAKDITTLNYKRMKELGFEGIIFDKDNTLTKPGNGLFATEEIEKSFD